MRLVRDEPLYGPGDRLDSQDIIRSNCLAEDEAATRLGRRLAVDTPHMFSHCRPNGIFLHVERNLTAVIFGVFLDALVSRHVIQLSRFGP